MSFKEEVENISKNLYTKPYYKETDIPRLKKFILEKANYSYNSIDFYLNNINFVNACGWTYVKSCDENNNLINEEELQWLIDEQFEVNLISSLNTAYEMYKISWNINKNI